MTTNFNAVPEQVRDKYIVNENSAKQLPAWLPFVIGFALVVQFAALGGWQVSRGLEKRAQQELFSDQSGFAAWAPGMQPRPYQRLQVQGEFDGEHQFLLDNIILNGRYGYYVVTPLLLNENNGVLLVNRGWIEKTVEGSAEAMLQIDATAVTVLGRAGSLPKAGYKMGDAVSSDSGWPKHAVYPGHGDIAAALGRDVLPFVLLLEPNSDIGFIRHWVPEEMGPGRHFAYALQWFAISAVLAALLVWHFRRRRASRSSAHV